MRKITRLRSGNKSRLYYIFGIIALCAFVSIGIGYSILTSTVRVDGTASITSTWKIVFTKAVENTMNEATTTSGPSITGGTTLDIGVELNKKGSQAIYDVTVQNQGTIDAVVKEIRLNDGEPSDLKVYISGLYKGFALKAGESKQFQVIAEWSASAPESSETEKDVNVSIDFEQETEGSEKPELSMPTYTVDYPNEVWTKEKNVTMKYPEGDGILYQYSTDGGRTWLIAPASTYVLKFSQDGTLYIRVSDGVSVLTTPLITIEKIDTVAPTVNISGNSSTWETSKTLTIHASDQGSGLASNPYSWDGGKTWTSVKEKEFTSNQTVNVWVKDNVGNINKQTVTINRIDIISPTVTITGNTQEWTNNKRLTIIASDNGNLASLPYSWDGGQSWTTEKEKEFTSNQTVNIWVKDSADNIAKIEVHISKIDGIMPDVNVNGNEDTWTASKTLVINASDKESGLANNPYSWDGGKTWTTEKEKEFTSNQTVNIWVKDKAGNIKKINISIVKIDVTKPTITAPTATSTTNSITVTSKQIDSNSGVKTVQYAIQKGGTWSSYQNSNVFNGLTHNTSYVVKTKTTDKAGNISESITYTIKTKILTVGSLTLKVGTSSGTNYTSNIWTNQNVYVSLNKADTGNTTYESISGSAQTIKSGTTNVTIVSTSGITTLRVKTTDGINTVYSDNYVIKKDGVLPIVSIIGNDDVWTTSKTLTINANDEDSGLTSNPYSWDGGQTWTTSKTKTYTSNQTVNIWVMDNVGNIKKASISITKIDTTKPTAPIVTNSSNGEWTASNVVVTLKSSDTGSGIDHYEWYENNTWTTRAISMSGGVGTITYTADRNLTIRFRAIDKAGNISSEATTVVKKDSTSPSNVKLAKGAVTSSSITISASATANTSGIRGYQFQINNGTWSTEQTGTTKTFTGLTKNASYSIKVRVYSNNGKYTEGSLTVTTSNISAPTYSVVTNTGGTKTVTITYNGTKTSNLVYEYSLDGGKNWKTVSGTSQKVEFIDAGTVVARVRDKGNSNNTVTASTFQVTFPINYLKDNLYLGGSQEVSFVNYLAPSNVSHTDVSLAKDDSIQQWKEGDITYIGSKRKIAANEDSSYLFSVNTSGDQGYMPPEIMSIEFNDWLDTSHVKNMAHMFHFFSGTTLDLSTFDTSNVTDMSYMFYEVNLETIDLSNFDTKKVITMESMFAQSWNLKHLTIPFDSTSLENVSAMFRWCDMLETIDFGYDFNMENVTDMSRMFQSCSRLKTYIDFAGTKVTNYDDFAKNAFTEDDSGLEFHVSISSISNGAEVSDLLSKIVESANNVNIRMTAS